MTIEQQSHTEATVITTIVMVLMFLFLWFVVMEVPALEEEEGVEISFGNSATGGGVTTGVANPQPAPLPQPTPPPAPAAPSNNDLMTQEDESDVRLREEQEKARRVQEEALAEQRRREAEQREQERLEKEQREEALRQERQAREQAAKDKASQYASMFGQTDNPNGANASSRESASSGTKGNPLGHGVSGGNSWTLDGRQIVGSLPKPSNDFKQAGKVVVNIIVDANGKVVQATVGKGTDISDQATIQLAVKAAYKAKFNMVDRPDKQMGSITFVFKFN